MSEKVHRPFVNLVEDIRWEFSPLWAGTNRGRQLPGKTRARPSGQPPVSVSVSFSPVRRGSSPCTLQVYWHARTPLNAGERLRMPL